jgi:predicted nuclease of predicted toxin-antitoxin system
MGAPTGGVADFLAAPGVRFLLDENIPPAFAEALRLVGYSVVSNREVGLRGADDLEVIDYCGQKRLVWVTNDLDARKKAAYAKRVSDARVSAVFLASSRAKRWSVKEQFEVIVKHLRTLESRYDAKTPRYFMCRATGQPLEASSFAARPGRK